MLSIARQVFDAEHLISVIRRDSNQEYLHVPQEPLGLWSFRANDQGHVLVTHLRQPTQLLVSPSLTNAIRRSVVLLGAIPYASLDRASSFVLRGGAAFTTTLGRPVEPAVGPAW
jgi:hypothetical protein